MTMPLALQVRQQMGQFVAGQQSLTQFEDWFVSAFWSGELGLDAATRDFGYEIELWLAEYSNGDWTEAELKEMFRQFVSRYVVSPEPAPRTASASAPMPWTYKEVGAAEQGRVENHTASASMSWDTAESYTASASRSAPSLKAA